MRTSSRNLSIRTFKAIFFTALAFAHPQFAIAQIAPSALEKEIADIEAEIEELDAEMGDLRREIRSNNAKIRKMGKEIPTCGAPCVNACSAAVLREDGSTRSDLDAHGVVKESSSVCYDLALAILDGKKSMSALKSSGCAQAVRGCGPANLALANAQISKDIEDIKENRSNVTRELARTKSKLGKAPKTGALKN